MFFIGTFRRWWRDRRRFLFRFWDGDRWRRACPLAVNAALTEAEPDYTKLLAALHADPASLPPGPVRADVEKQKNSAARRLVRAARKAFVLKELGDDEGCSDGEALGVLTAFFLWMEGLAEEARPFGNSPPPGPESPPASRP